MKRPRLTRWIFAVALTFTTAVVFRGVAAAQYYDDGYYQGSAQQAHQYGYQNGYRDGFRKGRHEGHENDPGDINVRALEQATHGYRPWMGPVQSFQDGYRDGYRRGFRSGYQSVNGWRGDNGGWGNRDDRYRYDY